MGNKAGKYKAVGAQEKSPSLERNGLDLWRRIVEEAVQRLPEDSREAAELKVDSGSFSLENIEEIVIGLASENLILEKSEDVQATGCQALPVDICKRLLDADEELVELRFNIVPKSISEDKFWNIYAFLVISAVQSSLRP